MSWARAWKFVREWQFLIVFILGDLVGTPFTNSLLHSLFPNPDANLLANEMVVTLLGLIIPGVIADLIWYWLKSSWPKR